MSDDHTLQPTASDLLRLDRCPDCGYLLTGLPEKGICPECGSAYSTEMIVLHGWATGSKADASNARGRKLVWCLAVGNIWCLIQILAALMKGSLRQLAVILACLTAMNVFLLWRRRRALEDVPRPEQLRLTPEGIGQRTGPGKVRLLPWSEVRWLFLDWCGGSRYKIEAEDGRRRWWRTPRNIHADVDLAEKELAHVLQQLALCFPRLRIYDIRDQARVRRIKQMEEQYGLGQAESGCPWRN